METATQQREYFELTVRYWLSHAIAALVGGLLMGLVMQEVMGEIQTVGELYGQGSVASGWAFHLWHALVFAAMFGGLFLWDRLSEYRDNVLISGALGVCWGLFLWIGAASILMPLWLSTVGTEGPPIFSFNLWSGVGHVTYGVVLGAGSALIQRAF